MANLTFKQCANLCDLGAQITMAGVTGYIAYAFLKYRLFEFSRSDEYLNNYQKLFVVPISCTTDW